MKIAVTYENGSVFQHFGHTAQFKLYTVEGGKVVSSCRKDTGGTGHGALAAWLQALDVDVLICGGIGAGARNALGAAGIQIFGGVRGDADEAVEMFLAGVLEYDPCARCSHHGAEHHGCGQHHHGEGHSCGTCGK